MVMRVPGLLSCPWREEKRRSFVKIVGQVWGDQAQIGAFSLSAATHSLISGPKDSVAFSLREIL